MVVVSGVVGTLKWNTEKKKSIEKLVNVVIISPGDSSGSRQKKVGLEMRSRCGTDYGAK